MTNIQIFTFLKRLPSNFNSIFYYLLDEGQLVQLGEGVLLKKATFEQIKADIIAFLREHGSITIQDVNRMFGFSRKYSIPLLGQLDKEKITRRQGDARVLA